MMGVVVWSLLTMGCGLARNFGQLFLARMGVGVGESALTPSAYAMVADAFPPQQLGRAMSVFALGGVVGGAASLFVGGSVAGFAQELGPVTLPIVGTIRPWQMVFVAVGMLSLALVVPLAMMSEPARQKRTQGESRIPRQLSFASVVHFMWDHRNFYGPYVAGVCLAALCLYGFTAWLPTYFIRVHGWDTAETGMRLGAISLVPALAGGICARVGWPIITLAGVTGPHR